MVTISLSQVEIKNIMDVYMNQEDIVALDDSIVVDDLIMMKKFFDNTKGITKEYVKSKMKEYFDTSLLSYYPGLPRFLKPQVKI